MGTMETMEGVRVGERNTRNKQSEICKRRLFVLLSFCFDQFHVLGFGESPFCLLQSGCSAVGFFHTWAEGITSQLLDALALAYGAAVERGRVGAAARALLVATAAAVVAH